MTVKHDELVLVIDFGAQYSQLIARRQAQLHLDTPYAAQISRGREAGGSRNERLLFAALT